MRQSKYNLATENGRLFQKWDDACDAICDLVLMEGDTLSHALGLVATDSGVAVGRLRQLMGGGDGRRMVYRRYIRSEAWDAVRKLKLKTVGNKCERCGASGVTIDVHHLNYDSLGNEQMSSLLAVCRGCHRVEDEERRARTEREILDRRVEGFARKKWGAGWMSDVGWSRASTEFQKWVDDD